jgi:hypothetical protein
VSLDVKEGRDPLGLQTTTQDRLMPRLLPGVLELSRRARYFSFHAYFLDKYRRLREPADGNSLSVFIKAREWEYGLAVLNCPHDCGSVPVGAQRLRAVVARQDPPYPRGESVESAFGGYGLYYRSPLADLGIVARAGTLLGDKPTTIDVLYDTERARRLAASFAEAVEATAYVQHWMLTSDPIPRDVLVEYARVACLCQLRSRSEEREAVHDALFGEDSEPVAASISTVQEIEAGDHELVTTTLIGPVEAAVTQRRRSVAHYLTLVDTDPTVVDDEGSYREALWAPTILRSADHALVAGQWAGLIAKDVWQDALCSVWSEFCQTGLDHCRAQLSDELSWDQVRSLARSMVQGPPSLDRDQPTATVAAAIGAGDTSLPGLDEPITEARLEHLRAATDTINSATSGLIVILELHRRASGRTDPGWLQSSHLRSAWQPSLAEVLAGLTSHLVDAPTVADTLWWIVHRFIFSVHERIAYSKLPEHTFRFRWEDGGVRFFDNGIGRFPLAAIRHEPLALLTGDLDLWQRDVQARTSLTARGQNFIREVFP